MTFEHFLLGLFSPKPLNAYVSQACEGVGWKPKGSTKSSSAFFGASIPPFKTTSAPQQQRCYTSPSMASFVPVSRPLSSWKALLRQSRCQKTCLRCLATMERTPSPPSIPPPPPPRLPSSYGSPYKLTQGPTHIRTILFDRLCYLCRG